MKTWKKALSLTLALALCLGLMAVPASAAGATLTEIVSEETYASFLSGFIYAIEGFHEGITWHGTATHDGYGAFDATGKVIVPPCTYYDVTNFSDGVAWGTRDRKRYAVDNTGRELFALREGLDSVGDFHDGLAKVYSRETNKYGYVDKTGKVVIPCEYNEYDINAGDFHDGLAVVYDAANAFYGYIDKTGKVVIPYQYTYASHFENGFALVRQGSRWTFIDPTGRDILPQDYQCNIAMSTDTSDYVLSGAAIARHQNGSCAFFNQSGQLVSGGYSGVYSYSNGMACVAKDGKCGFVNESGVLVIPCTLPSDGTFRDGYASILIPSNSGDSTYSIIDKTGKVTGSCKAYGTSPAGNGCFRIRSSESGRDRYGLVDYTGREIVPCKYKAIGDFSGGVAWVQNFEDKCGFVNTTGAEIVPCQYDGIRYTGETGVFEVERKIGGEMSTSILKSSGWTEPSVSTQPTTPVQPQQPVGTKTASPTNDKLTVNGVLADPTVYKIDGANYFKIRDVAALLNGTEKQFAVGYDGALKSVTATTGQGYDKQSGDLAGAAKGGGQSAAASNDAIYVNGEKITAEVYKIGGSNYFKLRDLGKALDFYVGWTAERGVFIETDKPYSE